jgi:hypothetical protein
LLLPSRLRTTHIFSVDSVTLRTLGNAIPVEPLYSLGRRAGAEAKAYWIARRKPSVSRRDTPEESLRRGESSVAAGEHQSEGVGDLLSGEGLARCAKRQAFQTRPIHRNLPKPLPIGAGAAQTNDFDLPGEGPFRRISALIAPSATVSPPLGKSQLWRLISLLSLNYVSITEGGPEPLRAMLRLHDMGDSPNWTGGDHINGLLEIRSAPHYTRIVREDGAGFARGRRIELDFDEDRFEAPAFTSLRAYLEQFLGSYVSLNSFSVVAARSEQRRELVRDGLRAPAGSRHSDELNSRTLYSRMLNRSSSSQLVRLLHQIYPDRKGVGEYSTRLDQEVARFGVPSTLAFPAGEVASSIRRLATPRSDVSSFMGLVGPGRRLPLGTRCWSTIACVTATRDCATSSTSFTIEIVSIFYRAWERTIFRGARARLNPIASRSTSRIWQASACRKSGEPASRHGVTAVLRWIAGAAPAVRGGARTTHRGLLRRRRNRGTVHRPLVRH